MIPDRSAPGSTPPAAAMASITRSPLFIAYTPGDITAPLTCTRMSVAVGAAAAVASGATMRTCAVSSPRVSSATAPAASATAANRASAAPPTRTTCPLIHCLRILVGLVGSIEYYQMIVLTEKVLIKNRREIRGLYRRIVALQFGWFAGHAPERATTSRGALPQRRIAFQFRWIARLRSVIPAKAGIQG